MRSEPRGRSFKAAASHAHDDAETIIFGPSLLQELIDGIRTSLTNAVSEAVSSLPFLGESNSSANASSSSLPAPSAAGSDQGKDTEIPAADDSVNASGYQKLTRRLRIAYESNLDKFVVYARRNSLSIPPKWKVQIVSNFLSSDDYDASSSASEGRIVETENRVATQARTEQPVDDVRAEQIPSDDQQQAIDDELEKLRSNLRAARIKGDVLRSRLDKVKRVLHHAETSARGIKRALDNSNVVGKDGLREAIIAVVTGKEELQALKMEGIELSSKLDSVRVVSEGQQMENTSDIGATAKHTLLDLAKPQERRCEDLLKNISADDAANLVSLLKKK